MTVRRGDRSGWIRAGLERRKPSLPGSVGVRRLPHGGYVVVYRMETDTSELPVARILPSGRSEGWLLEFAAGRDVWRPLDTLERRLDEVLDAIAADEFGCFLG